MNHNDVHPEMLPEGPYAAEQAAAVDAAKFWLAVFGTIASGGLLIAGLVVRRIIR
jgi:hypothetical protein